LGNFKELAAYVVMGLGERYFEGTGLSVRVVRGDSLVSFGLERVSGPCFSLWQRDIQTFLKSGIKLFDPHPLLPWTVSQSS
jgi:hypothetical protein